MDALVAFALLLLVVLAPRAIMHACCVDAGAALAALALLLLLVLALLLLSLLLLSLWLRRLQCLGLFRLPRFPFHDSQVSFFWCFSDANFRSPLGPILEPKMLPKCIQNWSQEAPKAL